MTIAQIKARLEELGAVLDPRCEDPITADTAAGSQVVWNATRRHSIACPVQDEEGHYQLKAALLDLLDQAKLGTSPCDGKTDGEWCDQCDEDAEAALARGR